jgi:hypothetical protein
VVGSPLHSVIEFSGCRLLRSLAGFQVHFPFGLEEYEAIFCAVVVLTDMELAVQRSECAWASAVSVATVWRVASLVVLSGSLVEGLLVPFLHRCPKVLLPVLWWSTTIIVNTMYWLGVVALIVIVAGSWGFVFL